MYPSPLVFGPISRNQFCSIVKDIPVSSSKIKILMVWLPFPDCLVTFSYCLGKIGKTHDFCRVDFHTTLILGVDLDR